jgi:PAS domain S-box-containing protein
MAKYNFSPRVPAKHGRLSRSRLPEGLSESFLNALYNGLTEAVLVVDLDTRHIVYWNKGAESMFGYSAEEMLGKTTRCLYPDEHAFQRIYALAAPKLHKQGYWRTEWEYQRRDGSRFPAGVGVTTFQEDHRTYLVDVIRDITDRKEMESTLLENERLAAVGIIASKLAHEISNPLNGMYTTAQLLERQLVRLGHKTDERLISTALELKNEIGRLRSLLQDFRSLSGPYKLNLEPTDLSVMARELLAIEAPQYAVYGIRAEVNISPGLPLVYADHEKLKQALLNLCNNAVEAMPRGGLLKVQCSSSRKHVYLEVVDNGTGVPKDLDIFQLFTTSKPNGTGLGLPIVKQIVTAHKGTITYSTGPGETTFRIRLPVYEPQA